MPCPPVGSCSCWCSRPCALISGLKGMRWLQLLRDARLWVLAATNVPSVRTFEMALPAIKEALASRARCTLYRNQNSSAFPPRLDFGQVVTLSQVILLGSMAAAVPGQCLFCFQVPRAPRSVNHERRLTYTSSQDFSIYCTYYSSM